MRFLGQIGIRCVACGLRPTFPPRPGSNPAVWHIGSIPVHLTGRILRIWYRAILTRTATPGSTSTRPPCATGASRGRSRSARLAASTYGRRAWRSPRRCGASAGPRTPGAMPARSARTCVGLHPDRHQHRWLERVRRDGDRHAAGRSRRRRRDLGSRPVPPRSHHLADQGPARAGRRVRLTYTARVTPDAADLTEGEHLVNRAVVGRYWGLPLVQRLLHWREAVTYPGGAADADTLTVRLPALSLTKTHSGDMERGGTGDYTLGVGNTGSWPTSAPVTVTDTPPVGMVVLPPRATGGPARSTASPPPAIAPTRWRPARATRRSSSVSRSPPTPRMRSPTPRQPPAAGAASRRRPQIRPSSTAPATSGGEPGISADRSHAVPGGLVAYTLRWRACHAPSLAHASATRCPRTPPW